MPLSPDASLFTPYTVWFIPNREKDLWAAVQVENGELIYAAPIEWPSEAEAEQHAADLNYLRARTIEALPTSNFWVSIDIASDGPAALTIVEKTLATDGRVLGWRLLNPAAPEDNDAWAKAREQVLNAIETLAAEELPFEDTETLVDHLVSRHGYAQNDFDPFRLENKDYITYWVRHHRDSLHQTTAVDHTHDWNDEEVDDDASDEEEGAREDSHH